MFSRLNGDGRVGTHERLAIRDPVFHFVGSLAQREFPERYQSGFSKELLQGLFSFRTFVDNSALQAMQQSPRSEIYHYYFVGLLDHPVG